jgi:hypothetical protein
MQGGGMQGGMTGGGMHGGQAVPADAFGVCGGTTTRLYVSNLSFDSTWQSLKEHFKHAGDVGFTKVMVVSLGCVVLGMVVNGVCCRAWW